MNMQQPEDKFIFAISKRYFMILVFLGVLVFLLGFILGKFVDYRSGTESQQIRGVSRGEYEFIDPLLECEIAENGSERYIPFERETRERIQKDVIDRNDTFVSVYFRNLNNGPWFGINELEEFTPASLMKVPLMIAYLKLSEDDDSLLEKQITYGGSRTNFKQAIVAGPRLEQGKQYPVSELIKRMIIYSDNEAMHVLLQNISERDISRVYEDLGISVPDVRTPDDFMSVKEYASFFRILYNASYLEKKGSEYALDLLSKSAYKDGLIAGVSGDVVISHKFGERALLDNTDEYTKQLHDCGIVYYEKYPYLLCVMTRGNNPEKMSKSIADISRIIFEEVSENYK